MSWLAFAFCLGAMGCLDRSHSESGEDGLRGKWFLREMTLSGSLSADIPGIMKRTKLIDTVLSLPEGEFFFHFKPCNCYFSKLPVPPNSFALEKQADQEIGMVLDSGSYDYAGETLLLITEKKDTISFGVTITGDSGIFAFKIDTRDKTGGSDIRTSLDIRYSVTRKF